MQHPDSIRQLRQMHANVAFNRFSRCVSTVIFVIFYVCGNYVLWLKLFDVWIAIWFN